MVSCRWQLTRLPARRRRCRSVRLDWIREGSCHEIPGIELGSGIRPKPDPPVGKPSLFQFILHVALPALAVGTHYGFNREARAHLQSPSAGFVRSSPPEVRVWEVP